MAVYEPPWTPVPTSPPHPEDGSGLPTCCTSTAQTLPLKPQLNVSVAIERKHFRRTGADEDRGASLWSGGWWDPTQAAWHGQVTQSGCLKKTTT